MAGFELCNEETGKDDLYRPSSGRNITRQEVALQEISGGNGEKFNGYPDIIIDNKFFGPYMNTTITSIVLFLALLPVSTYLAAAFFYNSFNAAWNVITTLPRHGEFGILGVLLAALLSSICELLYKGIALDRENTAPTSSSES